MRLGLAVAAMAVACAVTAPLFAQPAAGGQALYESRCKSCHEPALERAPNRTALAAMPRAQIVEALTSGVMSPMAGGLTDGQKAAIAAYLTPATAAGGRPQAAQPGVDVPCPTHPPIKAS